MRCKACNVAMTEEELYTMSIGRIEEGKVKVQEILNDLCFTCLGEAGIDAEDEILMRDELIKFLAVGGVKSKFLTKTQENLNN